MPDVAIIDDITDAVVSQLSTASLSQPLTTVFATELPDCSLEEITGIRVPVVGRDWQEEIGDRGRTAQIHFIDVGIQKQVDPTNLAAMRAIKQLVSEVIGVFKFQSLADFPAAKWFAADGNGGPIRDELRDKRLFDQIVTLTFRVLA